MEVSMRTAAEVRESKVHEPARVRRSPLPEPLLRPIAIIFTNGRIENVTLRDVYLDYEMHGL
jgi:hypothetical protein